jgi:hypothetical protein
MPEHMPLVNRLGGGLFDVQPLMPRGASSDYRAMEYHVRGLRRAATCFSDPAERTTAEAFWCERLAARNPDFRVVSLLHQRASEGSFLPPFPRSGALPEIRTVRAIAEELCRVLPAHRESIQGYAATLAAEIEARTVLSALAEGLLVERNPAERHREFIYPIGHAWRFSGTSSARLLNTPEGIR